MPFRPFVALRSHSSTGYPAFPVIRTRKERRANRRYPVRWRLEGRGLSFLGFADHQEEGLRGEVQNLSQGGLCVISERPIQKSSVLRCEIFPDTVPAGIPTVMEVRWIEAPAKSSGTRVGLRFLT